MSLINDALKRANQSKPTPTTPGDSSVPPLRPVDPPPSHQAGPAPWLLFLFPVALLLVCGIAGVLIYQGWRGSTDTIADPGAVVVAARENEPSTAPDSAAVHPSNDWVSITSTNAAASNDLLVAASEPTFPDLKLQGVFYRPSNPSAVINAKTVYRGDRVDTARVVAIGKNSVTVEWNGQRRVLTME